MLCGLSTVESELAKFNLNREKTRYIKCVTVHILAELLNLVSMRLDIIPNKH